MVRSGALTRADLQTVCSNIPVMGICISILFQTEFGDDAVLNAMPLALGLGYSARDVRIMFNFFHSCDIDGSGSVSITGEIRRPF